jgi:site-specific DNA-methyltransferase (adenine-specific)
MNAISFINAKGILFQADCLEVMATIESDTINCVFADPPFNINKPYHDTSYVDKITTDQYDQWTRAWLYECIRILKPGGSLFIYHLPYQLMQIGAFLNSIPVLTFKNWIALNMKNGFPIKNRLHPAHYGILYYTKNGCQSPFNVVRTQTPICRHCGKLIKDYGGYREKFKKWEDAAGIPWIQISDFWEDTRPTRHYKNRPLTTNELPYEIAERTILFSTNKGDIVLDPFGGSGSTCFAASLTDRLWIGIEIGSTNHIIQNLLRLDDSFQKKAPMKLRRIFNKSNLNSLAITDKREMELSELVKKYGARTRGKINKMRYSHRMTNKIFEDES